MVNKNLTRATTLRRQQIKVRKSHYILDLVFFILIFMFAGLFCVWPRIQIVEVSYQISRLNEKIKVLEQEEQGLRGKLCELRRPERLERIAEEHFGLSFPGPDQIVIIGNGLEKRTKERYALAKP